MSKAVSESKSTKRKRCEDVEPVNSGDVIVLLDASGSMESMGSEPVDSVNLFVSKQKLACENTLFSLHVFNDRIETVYEDTPIQEVKSYDSYEPDGSTSLYDCIGTVIDSTLKKERYTGIFLVIVTDGVDNTSRNYRVGKIKEMIEKVQTDYGWTVIYIGANHDVIGTARSLNIRTDSVNVFNSQTPGSLSDNISFVSDKISKLKLI